MGPTEGCGAKKFYNKLFENQKRVNGYGWACFLRGRSPLFIEPEGSSPQEVNAGRFQVHTKPDGLEPPDPKLLEAGFAIEEGHRPFDAGPIAIGILKGRGLLLLPSLGQGKRFMIIAEIMIFFPTMDRALIQKGTA